MHNFEDPEDLEIWSISRQEQREEESIYENCSSETSNPPPKGISSNDDEELDQKSIIDDEDNSLRSDLSKSEPLSDDTFQTPSTSLQNLSNYQNNSNNDELSRSEIKESESNQENYHKSSSNISTKSSTTTTTTITHTQSAENNNYSSSERKELTKSTLKEEIFSSPPSSSAVSSSHNLNNTSPINTPPILDQQFRSVQTIRSELTQSTESNISRESSSSSGNNSQTNASKDAALLPGNYNSKPSKKKMWYHVFTPSYKTRCAEFRKNFKELPKEERLITDYSCALQKEILVQGRMYVSQNYVSFYANIFGWQTNISMKFRDISTITKENTALVIPNAIQINTETEKYFFTSYTQREAAFLMLFELWQNALLDKNLQPKEIWNYVHACYGEVEIGSEEEEEEATEAIHEFLSDDSLTMTTTNNPSSPPIISSTRDSINTTNIITVCSHESDFPLGSIITSTTPLLSLNGDGVKSPSLSNGLGSSGFLGGTDLSDSSDSENELNDVGDMVEIPICSVSHSEGRTVVDAVIPCDVDTLFTLLFTNSKFYLDFHTGRKTLDIVQSDWTQKDGQTTREVSFTVTLNQRMGPKHSQLTETQILLPETKPGLLYAIDTESNNSGIPYADVFYVTCHFCLSRISAKESRLCVVAQVKYRKSIWGITKSFIDKNSWAGIEDFYSSLEKSLKEECTKIIGSTSSPPSPRNKNPNTSLRRRPLRQKRPAPGIPIAPSPNLATNNLNENISSVSGHDGAGVQSDIKNVSPESSMVLKIILTILLGLLLLNGFLFLKLNRLESDTSSPILFAPQTISYNKELPRNHKEWLELLQQQEALHHFELQKWHEVLLSALKILHEAESDLQLLKNHITTYSSGRQTTIPNHPHPPTDENSKENIKILQQTNDNEDVEYEKDKTNL